MTKFPLARGYCYSCGRRLLKTAEIIVMTTWGRILPRFDFSIIDYSVMAGSQASKQGFVGARGLSEF